MYLARINPSGIPIARINQPYILEKISDEIEPTAAAFSNAVVVAINIFYFLNFDKVDLNYYYSTFWKL